MINIQIRTNHRRHRRWARCRCWLSPKRISPQETISATIDGNKVTIVYGRPYSKDPKTGEIRKIWGKLWCLTARSGARARTRRPLLTTEQPIVLGGTTIPAGTYSLFTLPAANGTAKLIINKKTGQWGVPYKEDSEAANELARIDLKKDTLDKTVDQFTMAIEPNPAGGGVLENEVGKHRIRSAIHRQEITRRKEVVPDRSGSVVFCQCTVRKTGRFWTAPALPLSRKRKPD